MDRDGISALSFEQRQEAAAWLSSNLSTAPLYIRVTLQVILGHLCAPSVDERAFNRYGRQLARALGLLPSSERRGRSSRPSGGKLRSKPRPGQSEREWLEEQLEHSNGNIDWHGGHMGKHRRRKNWLKKRLRELDEAPGPEPEGVLTEAEILELDTTLTAEEQAAAEAAARATMEHLRLGDGPDASLESSREALMDARVVEVAEERAELPVKLPEGVSERDVVKTLHETRVRHDFSLSVTRLELEVEKKVVKTAEGRRVYTASTLDYGPPHYSVTWGALATLTVLIGQFALPFNRMATMLSTRAKRFTAGGLTRMAHYVAERLLPIYLELFDQLADADILAGDDTSCRVVEVSAYLSDPRPEAERGPPPWQAYRNAKDAGEVYAFYQKMTQALCPEGAPPADDGEEDDEPENPLGDPSLCLLVGKELDFESQRRDGKGAKQALNTTLVTGRSEADDPRSLVVFYRSHLGSLGNLLEMLLKKRKPKNRQLTVQSDLSTTNLVADPELCERFDLKLAGCTAHARRPFALYEDQDPICAPDMLHLFKGLAMHEHLLDRHGRNRENVLAVRGKDCRYIWDEIKDSAELMVQRWTKATPLGLAARYILKHFERLTVYLDDPRLEATNNLRERLLRSEKLIQKSALFRRTIEGRVVLDILRTILQTAVAANAPTQAYLVDVLRADPKDIEARPEHYTPRAWLARQPAASLDS